MKKLLLSIVIATIATIAVSATTKTFHAYVPTYMYSLGTMTISYNSSYVDFVYQGVNMHCSVLKILTTDDGTIYLLHNKAEQSYWILAISSTDGCLFKSNSSFSVRNMKAYLSTTRIQR